LASASSPRIELLPADRLTADQRREIIALCEAAF
jgi:hypothetical protein